MKRRTGKMMGVLAAGLVCVMLAGCKETDQEELVRLRGESETESGSTGQDATQTQAAVREGNIKDQVAAPDSFQMSFTDDADRIRVRVDARVEVPEAEGFRIKNVTSRTFTQTDYDAVNRVLLEGNAIWNRVVAEDDPAHGFTRSEIEERLKLLKEEQASGKKASDLYGGEEIDYEEKIAEWEAMLEAALEEERVEEFTPKVRYDEQAAASGKEDSNCFSGYVTVGDENFFVALDNNLTPEWRWIQFQADRVRDGSNYLPAQAPQEAVFATSTEELKEKAVAAVKEMGYEDYTAVGEEYFCSYRDTADGEREKDRMGYGIHFARLVDGIPVTYTHANGTVAEGDIPAWPYEDMYLVYDDQGLASFCWIDPYMIEDRTEEYVFLLPFEEISQVFRKLMLEKHAEFAEQGIEEEFVIDEIRLGYMRVIEKENPAEGTLVPVWDFFGSMTRRIPPQDEYEGETFTVGGGYESWMTINACDGTVIDREVGY